MTFALRSSNKENIIPLLNLLSWEIRFRRDLVKAREIWHMIRYDGTRKPEQKIGSTGCNNV